MSVKWGHTSGSMPCPSSHAKPGRKSVPPRPLIAPGKTVARRRVAAYSACRLPGAAAGPDRAGGHPPSGLLNPDRYQVASIQGWVVPSEAVPMQRRSVVLDPSPARAPAVERQSWNQADASRDDPFSTPTAGPERRRRCLPCRRGCRPGRRAAASRGGASAIRSRPTMVCESSERVGPPLWTTRRDDRDDCADSRQRRPEARCLPQLIPACVSRKRRRTSVFSLSFR